jgi:hypothetical protein
MRIGSGLRRAQASEIDFGISFEDWSHEDCRTDLHDVFAMSDTTESWSSVLRSSCARSSKDLPQDLEADLLARTFRLRHIFRRLIITRLIGLYSTTCSLCPTLLELSPLYFGMSGLRKICQRIMGGQRSTMETILALVATNW